MKTVNYLSIFIIILVIFFWKDHHDLKKQIDRLHSDIDDYEYALEETNSQIEYAQASAWSSYQEMGEVLENLETINP